MATVDLSIIIVNYNTKELVLECIKSIRQFTKGINYEVILIDNNSEEKLKNTLLLTTKNIKLIENKDNLGFTKANNQGVKVARGKYVLFLNSDTYIDSNVIGEMIAWMDANPKIGAATCKLKNKDGSSQVSGGYFPTLGRVLMWMTIQDLPLMDRLFNQFHPHKNKNKKYKLDWVTGAFYLARRDILQKINSFDEDYFMYGDDVDLSYRVKELGWEVWFNPKWSIVHHGGASSRREYPLLSEYKGIKIFFKKHYPKWQYPWLRLLLKIGALWRIVILGILEGAESAKIYAKAFTEA